MIYSEVSPISLFFCLTPVFCLCVCVCVCVFVFFFSFVFFFQTRVQCCRDGGFVLGWAVERRGGRGLNGQTIA